MAGWFSGTIGLFRMFAAGAYQQGAASTPTPVFMVLEGILLLCGIVLTFKAGTPAAKSEEQVASPSGPFLRAAEPEDLSLAPRVHQSASDSRAQPVEVDGVYPTAVPNSRPTPAVASIANAPQMVTLAAPTKMGAPPIRAASAPSDTRHNSETAETTGTSAVVGARRIVVPVLLRQQQMLPPTPARPAADEPRAPRSGRARRERGWRAPLGRQLPRHRPSQVEFQTPPHVDASEFVLLRLRVGRELVPLPPQSACSVSA